MYRIKNCFDLKKSNLEDKIIICGWIEKIRKLKDNCFIVLKDRYEKVQLVFSFENNFFFKKKINTLNIEDCILVYGLIKEKVGFPASIKNIEVNVFDFYIINKAFYLPLEIKNDNVSEDLRLKYRCLDLRRESIKKNIINKHFLYSIVFNFFNDNNFLYIETPSLTKFTPFGANNFIVPSSKKNYYFSLAESPQIFKQLLMISCYDKYFQFSKCFRNENLRKDRQPEFIQIDFEMSFVDIDDIIDVVEKLFFRIFYILFKKIIKTSFKKISYNDCINNYGCDKPDIRAEFFFIDLLFFFSLKEIFDIFFFISNIEKNSFFKFIIIKEEYFKILYNFLDVYELDNNFFILLKKNNSKWFFYNKNFEFFNEKFKSFSEFYNLDNGDFILITFGDDLNVINKNLFDIRSFLMNNITYKEEFSFIWVLEFPLFSYNYSINKVESIHHPFTKPLEYYLNDFSHLNRIKSKSYDLVINGVEIGGGSIRINNFLMQNLIFKILDLNKNIVGNCFDFFVNSLKISPPPHGGMALGIDRLCMLLFKSNSIREFISFPKSLNGSDLYFNSPNNTFF